jgi:hypothetical protein
VCTLAATTGHKIAGARTAENPVSPAAASILRIAAREAEGVPGERHLSAGSPQRACPNRIGAMRLFSQDTKVQALKSVPLFEGLSRKELVQLERICEDLQVEPGKVLCKEGQIGQEFFVIVDGTVQVTRKGKRVATLTGGDFLVRSH